MSEITYEMILEACGASSRRSAAEVAADNAAIEATFEASWAALHLRAPPTPPGHDDASHEASDNHEGMTTTTEAAQLLGYASTKGISQRIQRGRIPGAIKQGNTWLVPVAWVKEQQQTTTTATTMMKATKATESSIPHPRQATKGEEGSSPLLSTPDPDPVATISPDSRGVVHTQKGVGNPQASHDHALQLLQVKMAQLDKQREAVDRSCSRGILGSELMKIIMDEACSEYACYSSDSCLYYRTKGCPRYDENSRHTLKYALSASYFDKYNIDHMDIAPCFAFNF